MSNRLESLSGKKSITPGASSTASAPGAASPSGTGRPAAKTSLKFKPKTNVARRSQEERAKDAPITVKSETNGSHSSIRGGARGGRGGARGGRGGRNNNYAGTHIVSSGPLSSGSVSIGGGMNGSKTGLTQDRVYSTSQSPTPEFLQNLKLKDLSIKDQDGIRRSRSGSPSVAGGRDLSDDDEEYNDLTRINMNKEYKFADEETVLFPVRPVRVEAEAETFVSSNSSTPEPEQSVSVASATPTPGPSEGGDEVKVKSEEAEAEPIIKKEEAAERATAAAAAAASIVQQPKVAAEPISLDQSELLKATAEYKDIASLLVNSGATSDHEHAYTLLQLPKVLPTYERVSATETEAAEGDDGAVDTKAAEVPEHTTYSKFSAGPYPEKGQIGHINIHRSGKITINLGNDNVLDVSKGVSANFLQEIAVLDLESQSQAPDGENGDTSVMDVDGEDAPKGKILRLGPLSEKLIATPSLF